MNYRQLRILRHTELHPVHSLLPLPPVVVKSSPSLHPSSGRPYSPEAPPSSTTNEFTVASFVAAVIFFSLFAVYLRYFANRRQPPAPSSGKGVDRSTVLSLPVFDYNGAAKYQMDCAICLSEFNENETVKLIPFCKHVFHTECIDTWLFSHVSCPVCRSTRLFDADEDAAKGGSGAAKEDRRPGLGDGGERTTTENNDMIITMGSFGNGTRRISSCTSFTGPASMSLTRTCSF